MNVQIPFSKVAMFSPGKNSPEGESRLICDEYPTWADFKLLCVLLAIFQSRKESSLEIPKKKILRVWGKTCQGKNYRILEKTLKKWASCKMTLKGRGKVGIISSYNYRKSAKTIRIEFDKGFFDYSLKKGQVWDLDKIFSMNGVIFRLVQIFSANLHYKKEKEEIDFYPIPLAKMIAISVKKPHEARKRLRTKMPDVISELQARGLNCLQEWRKINGEQRLFVWKEESSSKREEKKKAEPCRQTNSANSTAEKSLKKKSEIPLKESPKFITNTSESQEEFEKACAFYETISSNFDRSSIKNYSGKVVELWEWHKEAIKFCASGQLLTRIYSGKKIVGWYKSGCQKGEFASYVEHTNIELAKQRAQEQTPELRQKMFDTMLKLMKSCSSEGKQELAKEICSSSSITNQYDAKQEFQYAAINKCLELPVMAKYKQPGYSDLINSLFLLDGFGRVAEKELPAQWWPKFELEHEIHRDEIKTNLRLLEPTKEAKKFQAMEKLCNDLIAKGGQILSAKEQVEQWREQGAI